MFGRKKERATTTAAEITHNEYRRAHLHALASDVRVTGQHGPVFHGAGTITATKEEMDRVLGDGWLDRAKPLHVVGGTIGLHRV